MATPQTHFIVQRADLVRELMFVASVVERRTTIPILSNVKIEATDAGTLILSGTDLEIGLTCSLPAEVKVAGVAFR